MTKRSTWATRNREAFNAAWRRWYRDNAARKMAWQTRRREEIKTWWRELKATKCCEECGESAPECLHFHHVDPQRKELELSHAVNRGWSRIRILAEVAKCRVLCANCHFKLHWNQRIS